MTFFLSSCDMFSPDQSGNIAITGMNGKDGKNGKDGADGKDGEDGIGIVSITLTSSEGLVDTYTINYSNGTKYTFKVTNGKDGSAVDKGDKGEKGDQGIQGIQGEKGEDGHTPIITIGENGNWYIDGIDTKKASNYKGDTGNGISDITKTSTEGLVDTYTITYTNGNTTVFYVTNGKDGSAVDKGDKGEKGDQGIQGIQGEKGEDGHTPIITIGENGNWYIDGVDSTKASQLKGDTGNGISDISLTSTEGLVDTYTITFTNGSTTTFTITNGEKGDQGDQGEKGDQGDQGEKGDGIKSITLKESTGLVDTYEIIFDDDSTTTFEIKNGKMPELRINSKTNYWEVSYDEGNTWISLETKATGPKGDRGYQGNTGYGSAYQEYLSMNPFYTGDEVQFFVDLNKGNLEFYCNVTYYTDPINEYNWDYIEYYRYGEPIGKEYGRYNNVYTYDGINYSFDHWEVDGKYFDTVNTKITKNIDLHAVYFENNVSDFLYVENDNGITITSYIGTDKKVAIPNELNGKKVTNISKDAFKNNKNIEYLNLSSYNVSYEEGWLNGCSNIKTIVALYNDDVSITESFGDIDSINDNLTIKLFDESCYNFNLGDFYNKKINVDIISLYGAKNNTLRLYILDSKIKDLHINVSTSLIEIYCNEIENVYLNKDLNYINSSFNGAKIENIIWPKSLKRIDYSFDNCSNLKQIKLPDSLYRIENSFNNCSDLENITLSNNLYICNYSFDNCNKLNYNFDEYNNKYLGTDENDYYMLLGYEKKYSIENMLYIHDDTKIISASSEIENYEHISLPNGLLSICRDSLGNNTNFVEINIPSSVTYVFNSAIGEKYCENINGLLYAGDFLVRIDDSFEEEDVIVREGTKGICCSFIMNQNVKIITLPNSLLTIDDYVFDYLNLENLIIPDSVKYIGKGLIGRSTIKHLKISDNLEFSDFLYSEYEHSVELIEAPTLFFECYNPSCNWKGLFKASKYYITSGDYIPTPDNNTNYIIVGEDTKTTAFYEITCNIYYLGTVGEIRSPHYVPHFYLYSENEPTSQKYLYWHFVENIPTRWEEN